ETKAKTISKKRRTVQLNIWCSPQEWTAVDRIAATKQLSKSKVGRAFIQQGINQELHAQQEALQEPILDQLLHKHRKQDRKILIRERYTTERILAIVSGLLNAIPGIPQTTVDDIMTRSADVAKRNI